MTNELTSLTNVVLEVLPRFEGYVYPNESGPHPLWGFLIVLYPYITGLVAGAFIMASLVRVFKVRALEPVYRLALLTALAFLLCATLPLLFHLGHPERCFEIMMTPHFSSPMAMFGFVYAWYLMAVLLLELWFDYRQDFVRWSKTEPGFRGIIYRAFTLGVMDVSEPAVRLDQRSSGASSRSSAFPRPFSCTATLDSSSVRSKPTRGGATSSCRSFSSSPPWFQASLSASSFTWC